MIFCEFFSSDGSMWHPFVQKTDTLYIFNTELCRSVYIEYEGEATLTASKIPVYSFGAPMSVMASGDDNPDNAGFCYPNASYCLKTGAMDVSPCRGYTLNTLFFKCCWIYLHIFDQFGSYTEINCSLSVSKSASQLKYDKNNLCRKLYMLDKRFFINHL